MINIDEETKENVKKILSGMKNKVTIKVSGEVPKEIVETIKSLAPEGKIEIEQISGDPRVEFNDNVIYLGTPSGYEFQTIVEDALDMSNGPSEIPEKTLERIKKINKPVEIQVLVTPQCPYCPISARLSHIFAMVNKNIKSIVVEVQEFPDIIKKYNVMAVPKIVINDKVEFEGAYPADPFLDKIEEAIKD